MKAVFMGQAGAGSMIKSGTVMVHLVTSLWSNMVVFRISKSRLINSANVANQASTRIQKQC